MSENFIKNSRSDEYIKAVGMFDNDKAGCKAIENLERQIDHSSAERNTFSIVRVCYKYSVILKSIRKV